MPSLITVGVFACVTAWNDFTGSLYLASMRNAPLPSAMVNLRRLTAAGVVVRTLPALILFLALQTYYVKGVAAGAVKG